MPESNQNIDNISENLYILHHLLNRAINREIACCDLTIPQVNVLRTLIQEDGLSLKELSKRVGLKHSTVSGIVDRLEKRELLTRETNLNDKRNIRICLTDLVREHKDSFTPQLFQQTTKKLESLSIEEQLKVLDSLKILNEIFEKEKDVF